MKRTINMQAFTDRLSLITFGMTHGEAHEQHICVSCRGSVFMHQFKTELAKKEYYISALCQSCQDRIFNTCNIAETVIKKDVIKDK